MADFNYRINRQGPRGPQGLQGEKGDPGNTFTVSEGVNTPTEYTLIFDGGDGNQFETDNLRNPIVDRGGTYVRYDRDNVVQYIGEPDMAVINETPGIVNLAGKDTVTPNANDAVAYELLEKTVDELNTALENLDGRLDDAEGDLTQAQSDIVGLDNRVTTNEGAITSLQSGKADKSTTYTKTEVNSALAGKANAVHTHTVSQITNAGALASQNTVDYQTQVTNKPTIPTVGNGTITLTQGGVTKGTFTTNQSGNSTIDLDAGGGSTLTAGSGINIANDTISVKVDGTTISTNNDGELTAIVSSGDTVAAGDGIVISPNIAIPGEKIIGVYYDGVTINKNGNGQLVAMIPDVSHMVTDNTTQSITGTKTYGAGNLKINDLCLSDGSKVIEDKGTYVYVGSPGVTTKIKSNNTKLYFNGQSGIDEEIAKVSQLPGTATSSTLGLVQPDNTTIAIDGNGVISANIPTPETVDQTYNASSTHAQSGVAIAGAGFMNGSIVQYPLQYLPDTTNVVNSLNDTDLTINRVNGDNNGEYSSSNTIRLYDSTDSSITDFTTDPKGLINKTTLGWVEYNFGSNFNLVLTGGIGDTGYGRFSTMYPAFFGYYENDEFIPVIVLSLDQPGYKNYARLKTIVNNTIVQNITTTNQDNGAYYMAIQYQSGVLKFRCVSDYGFLYNSRTTVTLSQAEREEIAKCTHVRVVPITKGNYTNNAYLSPFNTYYSKYYEIYNPSIDVINTEYPKNGQTSIFANSHPASLSLKYDSNTLGINSSNELTVPTATTSNLGLVKPDGSTITINDGVISAASSTPSNMVTTDTDQKITGIKTVPGVKFEPSNGSGYSLYLTQNDTTHIQFSGSSSFDTSSSAGIYLDKGGQIALSSRSGNACRIDMCTQYSNNTAEIRFCNGYSVGQAGSSSQSIGSYNGKMYLRNNATDKKIYKATSSPSSTTPTNFLLEKDMLDGTTISYDDTTGKVSTVGSFVPTTRTINAKPLSSDVTLTAEDVGALPDDTVLLKQYSDDLNEYGDLVNTNGILSGFSDYNYAEIPSKYFTVGNSIRVKFNFVTKSTARQYVLAGEGFLNVDINTSSTTLRTWNNTTSQNDNITTLTSGQDYYLRIDLKNTGKDFYVTQDPSNWGTAVTVADTAYVTTTPPDEVITIGLNTVKANSYWNSTIDSNYIEIYDSDGVLIYKIDDNDQIATKQRLGLIKPDGLTVAVNEQGLLSANISSGIGTSLSSEGNLNLIISDCDYNISSELNSMATTNTFNDGILELSHAGEWTSGNMLKNPYNGILIDEKYLTNVQDFEIVIKYKGDCGIILNSTPTTLNWMESTIAIPNLCAFGNVWWNNQLGDKNPRAFCYNIDGGNSFTPDYSINLLGITDKYKYWKLKREGSTLTYGYSSDGITYTTLYTSSSFSNTNSITGPISIGTSFVNDTPSGGMLRFGYSLDLKESYIKCDGKLTWGFYGTNGIAKATDTTYGLVTRNHPMPGDIFETVIVGASGAEYTASDTGWFILGFTASANNQYLEVTKPLDNGYGTSLNITVFRSQVYGSTTNYIGTSIPVKKGDKITVNYNTGGTNNIIFVPAAS